MTLDLSWVEPRHRDRAADLTPVILAACDRAERSKRFIDIQLNPKSEWRGWPQDVAEEWIQKRPSVLLRYLNGEIGPALVQKALMTHFQNEYKPRTGRARGMPPRVPTPGLEVPQAVAKALDSVTWAVMRKFGASPDQASFAQAAKVAAPEDSPDERTAMVLSVGTVKGSARKARYTSIRGDLYWGDVRNSLELFIRARPELLEEFTAWDRAGRPRAWEDGGSWYSKGPGNRVEANPLLRIRSGAHKRASEMISRWKREGHLSLDAVLEADGEEALWDLQKPRPEMRQHRPAKQGHEHYVWGLRDRVDCYEFPVDIISRGV